MKRYISLACVALIVVMCMVQPVSAADTSLDSGWIELLDYGGINGTESHTFYFTDSGQAKYYFESSRLLLLGYVEVLFYSNHIISGVLGNGDTSLTVERISTYYYRAYGYLPSYEDRGVFLTFDAVDSVSPTAVTIYSVRMNLLRESRYDIEAYCEITAADYNKTIHYIPSDEVNYRIFEATESYSDTFFYLYIHSDDWKKYDFIDFQLMFDVFDITSVSAVMGSVNVPFDISYIDGTNIDGNNFFVSIRMDLRGLDRTIDDYPMLTIMGRLDSGALNSIDFVNCSGFIILDDIDPEYYYLRTLIDICKSGFDNIGLWISNQSNAISSFLTTHFTNLDSWITTQTTAIQTQFTQLKTALSTHFSNLDNWIDSQTATLEAAIRGDPADGDELEAGADQIQDSVEDISKFEQDQQAVLDNNFEVIQNAVSVTGFAAALAFVQRYTEGIFFGMGDFFIVFSLPLFLGLFFYICSRIPGATRWRSRPPKESDS